MVSFENTEIAFSGKDNAGLKRAYFLFKMVGNPSLVRMGRTMTNIALSLHLPISGMIKKTIFKQFCGGETINDCDITTSELAKFNIGTILDFSVEGKNSESDLDNTAEEIIATTIKAKGNDAIPFCVFKVTGIGRFNLLAKVSAKEELNSDEKEDYRKVCERVDKICKAAFDAETPVFIDAEESWIQPAIDNLADAMMAKYNKLNTIVYNTIQMYRWDRLDFLKSSHQKALNGNYKLGIKLVRGAYMEKERKRAEENGYESPIQKTKENSDIDYNKALEYAVQNIQNIAICAGTHNEKSSSLLTELMAKHNIPPSNKQIYFAQLLGMSDHISYNLSNAGYNVAKYVPYGPVKEVLPYLIRRAEENTSVEGQTGRELSLLIKEIRRRKQSK